MKKITEYVLCAAIWYKNLPTHPHAQKNIATGLVVTGCNHAQIINLMRALSGKRTNLAESGEHEQGFLTSKNRYVNREEALNISIREGQVIEGETQSPYRLFSEDLY